MGPTRTSELTLVEGGGDGLATSQQWKPTPGLGVASPLCGIFQMAPLSLLEELVQLFTHSCPPVEDARPWGRTTTWVPEPRCPSFH